MGEHAGDRLDQRLGGGRHGPLGLALCVPVVGGAQGLHRFSQGADTVVELRLEIHQFPSSVAVAASSKLRGCIVTTSPLSPRRTCRAWSPTFTSSACSGSLSRNL